MVFDEVFFFKKKGLVHLGQNLSSVVRIVDSHHTGSHLLPVFRDFVFYWFLLRLRLIIIAFDIGLTLLLLRLMLLLIVIIVLL